MPRRNKPVMVNGEIIATTYLTEDDHCDYCGQARCQWQNHAEARADVRDWEIESRKQEFPFGDHHEGDPDHDDDY